ncbi:MAG TPA: hypothetical protein DCY48_04865 [Candidatus Magasanikbacteria bacterium]|nr:hypothetical protein [Candidatus Magasanikbacteria bacterium]
MILSRQRKNNHCMLSDHISEYSESSFHNKWRNLAALFVVFGIVIVGTVWRNQIFFRADGIAAPLKNFSVRALENVSAEEGGDVAVERPISVAPSLPAFKGAWLSPDTLSARSLLVKDHATGFVLYQKNEYEPWPIASMTKLMSALVLLEHSLDWSAPLSVVSDELIDTHMYAGDTYARDELWQAALIGSSNKAITTLADSTEWTREAFIERMNQKALELGMADTMFVDVTGLSAGNVSTASDVALLLREALSQKKIYDALTIREVTLYSKERNVRHHIWNTNWLLLGWIENNFAEIAGGKTGYIPAALYNLTVQVSDDNHHAVDVVVLGAHSHEARFTEARDAAEWAFQNYEWPGEADVLSDAPIQETRQ